MKVSNQLYASTAFSPGKASWRPLYSRLRGPQRRIGRFGEEQDHLRLARSEPCFLGFNKYIYILFPMARQPLVGQGLLVEASR